MDAEKHRRIERRAYAVWEAEGYPHGRHEEHWHVAARQIEAEEGAQPASRQKRRRVSEASGRKKSKA